MANPNPLLSERIKVRCDCHVIICHRVLTDGVWAIHARYGPKNRRFSVISEPGNYETYLVITCAKCGNVHRVKADKGIVESYDGKNT